MNAFEIAAITFAAFLNGWFVSRLVKLETQGKRWPLMRRLLFNSLLMTTFLLGGLCLSWWYNYHHLPSWQTFIVTPFTASAGASFGLYRQEMRERFHIGSYRKQRNHRA